MSEMDETVIAYKFLQNFILSEPLYKTVEFDAKWYSSFAGFSRMIDHDYCDYCSENSVFKWNNDQYIHDMFCKLSEYNIESQNPIIRSINEPHRNQPFFIDYLFFCTGCKRIHYYTLMFKGNTVTKIGQYPSFASKEKLELKKYKKLNIVKKYYIELMHSVDAYSQHMGIAAFVYLRRIYEHIVETEYSKLSMEKNEKASFDEKMKAVDKEIHIIPEALASQKSKIYSVLSKGIHEYDEDECYEMYPVIRNVILFILNRYLAQKEEQKLQEDARKLLASK
ncbi:MAG: hypothetical protein K2G88_02055 [Oscillospiraceae bacterium]|nr:hypothetical protein [Oscillospiraceae bacterium]